MVSSESNMNAKALRVADRRYRDRARVARVAQAQALADSSEVSRKAAYDARNAAAAPWRARAAAAAAVAARRQAEAAKATRAAADASKAPKKSP